jgi:hypothetical protein
MAAQPSLIKLLDKWTGPLGALTVIIGGVIWLTTLHSLTQQNQRKINDIKDELDTSKSMIFSRLQNLDERLARMEGKIDMIVERSN